MIQKELLNDFYAEPLNEEILGSVLEYTAAIGAISTRRRMEELLRECPKRQKKKNRPKHANLPPTNIKDFF